MSSLTSNDMDTNPPAPDPQAPITRKGFLISLKNSGTPMPIPEQNLVGKRRQAFGYYDDFNLIF